VLEHFIIKAHNIVMKNVWEGIEFNKMRAKSEVIVFRGEKKDFYISACYSPTNDHLYIGI